MDFGRLTNLAIVCFGCHVAGGGGSDDSVVGILLLLGSLCCDGITGSYQRMFMDEFRPSTHKLMAGMNLWSIVILAFPIVLSGQGFVHQRLLLLVCRSFAAQKLTELASMH